MLAKTGPNSVKSTDGFSVKRRDRNTLEYKDGEKLLLIEVEPGDGLAVYLSSVRFWNTPAGLAVSSSDRSEITRRLERSLEFLGTKHILL